MTINEDLLDAAVRHQVYLQRYSTSVVRKIIALLNRVDDDLTAQLVKFDPTKAPASFTQRRLEQLLAAMRDINHEAYSSIRDPLRDELRALAAYEVDFTARMVGQTLPIAFEIIKPSSQMLNAIVTQRPFQGRLLREWVVGLEEGRYARLRDAIRMGMAEGETIDQMVRRVRGTRALNFRDGILEISRRHAESVVRTAVAHVANSAREEFHRENEDLLSGVLWLSTLDSRTTPVCQVRDGKKYTLDHEPIGHTTPWLAGPGKVHFGCRSTSVAVVKSWRELGIDLDEAPEGTRAAMDGQVPADVTYEQWLRRQPREVVEDILGQKKAALFVDGKLSVSSFVDDRGRSYTLDELRRREAAAFALAGV